MGRARRSVLLGVALLVCAGIFDAEPLYVGAVAFVALGLGAEAWVRLAAAGARVEREVGARTIAEEDPLPLRLTVRSGRAPLPGGVVEEPLLAQPVAIAVGRRTAHIRIDVRFSRRGRRRLGPPRLVLADPLGLGQRVVAGEGEDTVLVLPRTFPVRAPSGWGAAMSGHSRNALTSAAESEVDGLRPHQPGSPASRIHWPAVARGHGMMERRMRAELDSRPLVVLDTRGPAEPEAVDQAVRAAASLSLHLARAGGCALLLPGERRPASVEPDLAAWPAAHARLALVEPGGSPAVVGPRSGAVLYVAARLPGTGANATPRALRETSGPRLLVVPHRLPATTPAFEVAGCQGYAVGRGLDAARLAGVRA